jgi:hypothetical protein
MVSLNVIRSVAVAGVALAFSVATANATPAYYGTDSVTAEAPGTVYDGGTGSGGGLCTLGTSPCLSHVGAGPLSGGYITVTAPTSGIAYYQISVTISGVAGNANGSIWDVTLVNTNNNTGVSLGLTNIVGTNTNGSGTVNAIVTGTGTFTIGITDLLEQYAAGGTDPLPGVLDGLGSSDPLDANAITSPESLSSVFQLSATATNVPEPASVTLFIGGIAALGSFRRRRAR